ncbi:GNAT family N-acetyltransferase [Sulfitobacter aestuariivivens]|uniref:N-acetyltransferase family protein n=1 Tax=Sulfitobacter aestuariivivens TaxID=2766981 RepID=A0A927D0A9_9RHOB|nr:N-acetyltransferase family protein [Sulfitobacter aestuariivivens]
MTIRPAVTGDAACICSLWNAMIRDTLATFTTEQKTPEEIADLIAQRHDAFWVVGADKITGFVTYGAFRSGPGYLATVEHTIILSPKAQGQGTGRALMERAQITATAQGKHIMVAGISSANPDAVAFHEKIGFTQTARMPEVGRKAGQWLDLILMQKTLATR